VESGLERDRILRVMEVLIVLVLCAVTVAEILVDVTGPARWLDACVFGAAITLPLLARKRAPLAAVVVVITAVMANVAVNGMSAGGPGPWFILVLSALVVGALPDGRRAIVGAVVVAAPVVLLGGSKVRAGEDISELLAPLAFLAAVWTVGRVVARRRRRAEGVERRAKELERTADEIAVRAAEHERARIARELHDVVTHGMSVMVVQSQAAQSLAATDADGAREAMRAVEEAGREALGEMRRLLGVIRGDGSAVSRTPQPRLEDVPALIERVRRAGLPVTYRADGDGASVPPGVAVSAYRVVQEALTNVVKHAGSVPTAVSTRRDQAALEVTVTNGPPSTAPLTVAGGGAGLAGMTERVAVYAGVLEAGPSTDGGFTVRAVFPVGAR
jgi:signal transduction histidine kinase